MSTTVSASFQSFQILSEVTKSKHLEQSPVHEYISCVTEDSDPSARETETERNRSFQSFQIPSEVTKYKHLEQSPEGILGCLSSDTKKAMKEKW